MSDSTALATVPTGGLFAAAPSSIFDNLDKLAQYNELAVSFAASSFVPQAFQGKPSECLIALEYAANLGMRPLMVMQNLHVVKGKPSWDGKFIGSVIRACGRFRNVRYEMGQDSVIPEAWVQGAFEQSARKVQNVPNLTCRLIAEDALTGQEVRGTLITIQMAVAEGWYGGKGSKWPNMPEQMLQYRAASFFGRVYVQDILLGMHTVEESYEIAQQDAGTGAVEITDGVSGEAPRTRGRRQGAAAPTVATPAKVVGETQPGEYVSSEPVAEANTAPVATPPAPAAAAPATPAPAPVAAAPAAPTPPAGAPAPFVIQSRHIAVLLKLQKQPLAVMLSDEERKTVKEFGNAYPDFLKLPQRMGSKTELAISPEGLEFLGSDPAAVAAYDALAKDAETLGEVSPKESAGMTNAPDATPAPAAPTMADMPLVNTPDGGTAAAPAMTAQPGGAAPKSQTELNQEARNATAAQQYAGPAQVGNMDNIATPYADAVPSPFAEVKKPITAEEMLAQKRAELAARDAASPASPAPAAAPVAEAPAADDNVDDLFDKPL